jgi:zinc protease
MNFVILRRMSALLVVALFSVMSHATSDVPAIPFEKYTLKNGLEVILVEDKRLPLVAVNVWYKVGAANEEPGLTGFAHLFEHMMFAGSRHVPRGAADRLLEGAGVTDSNGTTNNDRTNYFDTVPANQLELALWIHSDRMGFLLDVLDRQALANQQDVVRNERRQRVENQPYGLVAEALWKTLYPADHPYHADVIGSHADIQNANLEDIKRFFKKYYRPNNASLTIVGDIDKARTKALIEKYFGTFNRGEAIAPVKLQAPVLTAERRVTIKDRIELPKVIIGYPTPATFASGDAEMVVLGQLLGTGKASRLYQSLIYRDQLAQEVSTFQYSMQQGSVFYMDITAKPGVAPERLLAAIDVEMARIAREGVTVAEIDRARNVMETELFGSLQKIGGWGLAERLSFYNFHTGDPGYLGKEVAAWRQVTPESIKAAAARFLQSNQRVVVFGVPGAKDLGTPVPTPPPLTSQPGEGAESLHQPEPWRATQPKPAGDLRFALPEAATFRLANGLTVMHHRESRFPLVAMNLVVRAGNLHNPLARPGLASFTSALLEEGTRTRSSQQIAEELASLGTSLSISTADESTHLSAFSLKRNAGKGVAVLADVIRAPAFANAEIERLKKRRLADIALNRSNPQSVASTAFAAAIYGTRHPLGTDAIGTEASVKALNAAAIRQFWQTYYQPANMALILTGDLSLEEARTLAEQAFGSWRGKAVPAARKHSLKTTPARLVTVDVPDSPQAAIRVVTRGPTAVAADLAEVEVMNAAFGGLFTSRVNDLLREQKGYTYGTYSRLVNNRESGFFNIRGSIRGDVTGPALADIMNEIDGLRSRPITGAELDKARVSQQLTLPSMFEAVGSVANSFAYLFAYRLPTDFFNRYAARVQAVDAAIVAGVVDRYMRKDNWRVIVVGDAKALEPQLAPLKLLPRERRAVDGALQP